MNQARAFGLSAALAAFAFSPGITARPEEAYGIPERDPDVAPLLEAEPLALPRIHITVVGTGLSANALERALGPALRASYDLRFSSAQRFGPEDLFRARTQSAASIHVWVDTTTPGSARLYFASRDGTRYLLRTLKLSPSLDEMDHEALAQAVEWSLQALAQGSAGLTRAEAEALFSEPSKPPRGASREPAAPRRSSGPWRRETEGYLPEVALLHRWSPHSAELLKAHGPVLRFSIDRLTAGHQFGFSLSAQYQYPQRYVDSGVALELEGVGARFDARYLSTGLVGGSGVGLRVGVGLDAVFATPEVLDQGRLEATGSRSNQVPLIGGGLLWQFRAEPGVRLELGVGAELDLVEIHYHVVDGERTTALVSRWPVRPALSVGVALF